LKYKPRYNLIISKVIVYHNITPQKTNKSDKNMDPLTIILIISMIGLVSNLFRVLRRREPIKDVKPITPKMRVIAPVMHEEDNLCVVSQ
jgi:hypothetical protein